MIRRMTMQTQRRNDLRSAGLATLLLFAAAGCGDDDDASGGAPASAALSALEPSQLAALCKQLLPKIRSSSTPARQCTLEALESDGEASCKEASQSCIDSKDYDDWTKAKCADLAAAKDPPHFDCSKKVSEVSACFDSASKWLAGLNCELSTDSSDLTPPDCLAELQADDCGFNIDDLLVDDDFRAQKSDEYVCKDGDESVPYDLMTGVECNQCATEHCCDSFVSCLNDTACSCFLGCSGEDTACFAKCKIKDYPDAFNDHVSCLSAGCADACGL
jgi:hypothetical protein